MIVVKNLIDVHFTGLGETYRTPTETRELPKKSVSVRRLDLVH